MMKATINGVSIEGTPGEIAELLKAMNLKSPTSDSIDGQIEGPDRHPHVNEDIGFRALKRRPLSAEQKVFLSKLSTEHPKWVLATDLQEATGYSKAQFAGLLGAFGKRVAATEGFEQGTWFYDGKWNYDSDCYQYRLPEHLVEVVNRAIK